MYTQICPVLGVMLARDVLTKPFSSFLQVTQLSTGIHILSTKIRPKREKSTWHTILEGSVSLKEIISGFKKPLHNGVYANSPGYPQDLQLTAQMSLLLYGLLIQISWTKSTF